MTSELLLLIKRERKALKGRHYAESERIKNFLSINNKTFPLLLFICALVVYHIRYLFAAASS